MLQAHLLSVFDNTKTVTFDENNYDKILAITSQEGETIRLKRPVMATVSAVSACSIFLIVSYRIISQFVVVCMLWSST